MAGDRRDDDAGPGDVEHVAGELRRVDRPVEIDLRVDARDDISLRVAVHRHQAAAAHFGELHPFRILGHGALRAGDRDLDVVRPIAAEGVRGALLRAARSVAEVPGDAIGCRHIDHGDELDGSGHFIGDAGFDGNAAGATDAIDVRFMFDRAGLIGKEVAEVEAAGAGGERRDGRVAGAGVLEERMSGSDVAGCVEGELADALSELGGAGDERGARFAHECMIEFVVCEAAAAERGRLHEGDVHRSDRRLPVVRRVGAHVVVAAAPTEIHPRTDPGQPVDAGAVFHFPQRSVRRPPRPAERIAEAVRVDVVGRGDAVRAVVERVVGGRRTVEIQAENLAAEGMKVGRQLGAESVADVHVELSIRTDAHAGDLMRGADLLAGHFEHGGDARRTPAAVVAVDADDLRVVLARAVACLVHHGDEEIARGRIDRGADAAVLARAGEDASGIEVEESRHVRAHRAVAQDHLNRPVELRDVEERRVRIRQRMRDECDVDRQLKTGRHAFHDISAIENSPRHFGRTGQFCEVRRDVAERRIE